MTTPLLALALVTSAFFIAIVVLMVIGLTDRARISQLRRISAAEQGTVTFLFENERLVDATRAARELLTTGPKIGTDWARLSALLEPRFPRLNVWISELADLGQMQRTSADGTGTLHAEWYDGLARITLAAVGTQSSHNMPDQHALAAINDELETLRAATDHLPHPIWVENATGQITWCNRAYLTLAEVAGGEESLQSWPPAPLFTLDSDQTTARVAMTPKGDSTRHWFTVERQVLTQGSVLTATPADDLVKAETSLSEFITTLTKTFAALPIGLAIFNRDQELAVFNPALLDLTMLPVDFLIAKPNVASFLDRLREMQMMPEPKDYKTWRQHVADLVTRARNGTFEEKWSLPGGQTYRVTGRPHPDGAVAFLFEDISAEISLTRKFRADIDTSRAVLDAMPVALAVFSTSGVMTMTNANYDSLWQTQTTDDVSIFDAVETWKSRVAPTSIWDDMRAFVGHAGSRQAWSAQIVLLDGRPMTCRLVPLPQGFTMVEFGPPAKSLGTDSVDDPATQRLVSVGP